MSGTVLLLENVAGLDTTTEYPSSTGLNPCKLELLLKYPSDLSVRPSVSGLGSCDLGSSLESESV